VKEKIIRSTVGLASLAFFHYLMEQQFQQIRVGRCANKLVGKASFSLHFSFVLSLVSIFSFKVKFGFQSTVQIQYTDQIYV
jgi:hypothetical protein